MADKPKGKVKKNPDGSYEVSSPLSESNIDQVCDTNDWEGLREIIKALSK